MIDNIENISPRRPDIIISEIDLLGFRKKMDVSAAVDALLQGENVLIEDFYSSGLQVLAELKNVLKYKYSDSSFQGQREYRSAFHDASHHLLLLVENNKLAVRKAPEIGWLKILYPDFSDFLISFPEVQGLNSSWQWYQKGIEIPILKSKIHPYFGTYFPTRFDHLELFDSWLKKYRGNKENAIEIGVGSGVLSFQLLNNGFQQVFSTDSNKNAIIGVNEESIRLHVDGKLELSHGDLFADCNFSAELIVFNPPWLIAGHKLEEGIDKAIYYDEDLFPRFFKEAKKHLAKEGKLVLIFSNFAQVVGTDDIHPIRKELAANDRFKKELLLQKKVKPSSKKTKRKDWRKDEKVELWVLTGND